MTRAILVFAILLSAVMARASYFRADLPTLNASSNIGTHVILTGKGLEVGDQWLRAGHTQALVFRDRSGTGAVRLIGAIENSKTLPMLQAWGYTNIQVFDKTMTGNAVLEQLEQVKKIASIDFIGHNGALFGLALEDYNNRFFVEHAKALKNFRNRMGPDAVVRLLGCNTGWILAPSIANVLNVPVSGTFTFADIQAMFSTNEWFYNDEGRYPESLTYQTTNSISFSEPVTCVKQGGCLRLKTVNTNYQGVHGNYGGTLPFAKYFCGALKEDECFRRMAKSTRNLVSTVPFKNNPTPEQFAQIMADYFCPSWKDDARRADCRGKITAHVLGTKALPKNFTTSEGSMVCDFSICQYRKNGNILESTGDGKNSTAYVDELNAYMRGYNIWMHQ